MVSGLAAGFSTCTAPPRPTAVAGAVTQLQDRVDRALADRGAGDINAAHAGLGRERHEVGLELVHVPAADAIGLLGQNHDGAPFRRLVSERGELGRIGEVLLGDAPNGPERGRLAVAERDGPGLVEKERIHVTGRLDGAAGHGQDIEANQAVHPGDADRGQQRADRGRDQGDEERHKHKQRDRPTRIGSEARDRGRREDEDDRHPGEQDVERDLVRRLLSLGSFHQADHVIEEGLALGGGDADLDPVREDLRAAGHGGPVAAGFADHRRRLAGDGGLVHRGHALDHLAVGGNDVACFDQDDVAHLEARAGHEPVGVALASAEELGLGLGAGPAQRVGLRLAAPFRDGLGKVGEQNGEPEP